MTAGADNYMCRFRIIMLSNSRVMACVSYISYVVNGRVPKPTSRHYIMRYYKPGVENIFWIECQIFPIKLLQIVHVPRKRRNKTQFSKDIHIEFDVLKPMISMIFVGISQRIKC